MKKIILFMSLVQVFHLQAQINVFDCGIYVDAVTQQEIDNATNTYVGSCILFDDNQQFLFNGSSNKEVVAATSIHLKDGFHAGPYNNDGKMHLRIATSNDLNVAVMNYDDLYNVKRYKKLELGVELPTDIANRVSNFLLLEGQHADELNPFLDWDLDVEAVFYSPTGGWYQTIDGFYYRDFEEDVANDFWQEVPTDYKMRVRFAPPKNGKWYCQVHIKVNGVLVNSSEWFGFNVVESGDPGFVKVHPNKRNLTVGGKIIFPVGHNFTAPYTSDGAGLWGEGYTATTTHKSTPYSAWQNYKNRVESYMNQGGKYIATGQFPASSLIEFEKKGNYYDRLHYAWEQDKVLDMCEQYDTRMLFTLLWHTPTMKYANYGLHNWDWDHYDKYGVHHPNDPFPVYCYNSAPGLKLPHEMFTDLSDLEYHKQRTRYYIARYGYSTKIYEFELVSETFQMGQDNFGNPYANASHTDHTAVRDAIHNYSSVISSYIKNDLNRNEQLIGINTHNGDWTPEDQSQFDQSIGIGTIDVIGINTYRAFPNDLLISKGKNDPYDFEDGENSLARRNDFYTTQGKPVIYSECGVPDDFAGCSNYSEIPVLAMAFGFTGCAGFNFWPGFDVGQEGLWPQTIIAEQHMNSDHVVETLGRSNGDWRQGRQKEKIYNSDNIAIKENQYYRSGDKELASGYVRNRSYNIHTMWIDSDCLITDTDRIDEPIDNLENVTWNEGNKVLVVEDLKKNTDYRIDWFDKNNNHIKQDCQNTNKRKLKLKFPDLTVKVASINIRPVLWYNIYQHNCDGNKSMTITEEDSDENQKELVYLERMSELENHSTIHPNPSSTILVVESMKDQNLKISGINTPNISNYQLLKGSNLLDIQSLASGIYFITFSEENITIKFVKL